MSKDNTTQGSPPKSEFWASVKLLLLIILLVLVPLTLRDIQWQEEHLKTISRSIGALCATLILYGLIKHLARVVLVLSLVLIAFMILVSEDLIDLPRFIGG